MKKLPALAGVMAVVIVLAYGQRVSIAARLMEKALEALRGADTVAELEDRMNLALCGAGGPMPAINAAGVQAISFAKPPLGGRTGPGV